MSVAVVILAYNNCHYLKKFLPVLEKHTDNSADIWVVDNASTDDTKNLLNNKHPRVKCLFLDKNYGFAKGYNKAIEHINAEVLVLLNSDVSVSEGWLLPLTRVLESDKVGAVQPKILDFKKQDHFEYAGAAGGYIDALAYPFCRGRLFNSIEADRGQYNDDTDIFWATGACLAIRRKVFLKVGGFDGDFFAHMEEIDLCWRLQHMGFVNRYTSKSVVYHVGGGSLKVGNPFKTFLNFRNSLLMIIKNTQGAVVIPILFVRMLLDGVAALKFLFAGELSHFWSILKAHFAFYALLPKYLKKRKRVLKIHVQKYPISIVWEYFIRGNKTFEQLS